jgi:DNA-binding MurR/RpiR family transcriptional regulator
VRKFGSIRRLARELNVSHAAVVKWSRSHETHPSNMNLKQVIKLALELNPSETVKILKRDFEKHGSTLKKVGPF